MNYANLFAPVSTELQAALVAIVPIALGVFGIIVAIRLGARLLTEMVGGSSDEDEEDG
jgi:hypothetical protein